MTGLRAEGAIPDVMRAARLDRETYDLKVTEVPVPELRPGYVLVRIRACGVCLSDVHLIDGELSSPLMVLTPGHEPAGEVVATGTSDSHWRPGDRVVVDAGVPCGSCVMCRRGMADQCESSQIMGIHYDGAWAEYVVVPQTTLAGIPEGLSFPEAALTADAVSTPYAALTDTARLRPGMSVGLWGIGGLGYHAVAIARLCGAAPVVAVDPSAVARERSLEAGADVALDPSDPVFADKVRSATSGRGIDVALDLVGANAVLRQAESVAARHGRLVVVGLSKEEVMLGSSEDIGYRGLRLEGHLGYRRRHLEEVLTLVRHRRLDLSRSVSARYSLANVVEAVDHLRTKRGNPIRVVLEP